MKKKVYRCRLCGEAYYSINGEFPNCPFCGAHPSMLVEAEKYADPFGAIDLTAQEQDDLVAAWKLELRNTAFYSGASKAALKEGDIAHASMFKILSKVEKEHASAIKKTLKASPPELEGLDKQHSPNLKENLAAANVRERKAVELYTQFAGRATAPRLKELFTAIAEVEEDHIIMTE